MRASVVIPVWNGGAVIEPCLQAVFASSGGELEEVICVDNASADDSAARIAARFPQVALLRQSVNLGFAGGANAGIAAARGDAFVLLNQDCLPEAGWLRAVGAAFEACPHAGIAGCTILNADGSIDHAGARMTRPSAYGEHLTDVGDGRPRAVDYVTGAAFAIRRAAVDAIGTFDEAYYPAYYEEADLCYRARAHGLDVIYTPGARIRHLRSSTEAHRAPIKHAANQHRQRLRFVLKHWSLEELIAFFAREHEAATGEPALHQSIGRVLAARHTLRNLDAILAARARDLGAQTSPAQRRLMEVGLADAVQLAFARSDALAQTAPLEAIRGEGAVHAPAGLRVKLNTMTARLARDATATASLERRIALLATLEQHEFPG